MPALGPIVPLTTYVSPGDAERVRDAAAAADRSVAAEIRRAIAHHLTKSESPAATPSSRHDFAAGTGDHASPPE